MTQPGLVHVEDLLPAAVFPVARHAPVLLVLDGMSAANAAEIIASVLGRAAESVWRAPATSIRFTLHCGACPVSGVARDPRPRMGRRQRVLEETTAVPAHEAPYQAQPMLPRPGADRIDRRLPAVGVSAGRWIDVMRVVLFIGTALLALQTCAAVPPSG